jgi:hypothetical protein
MTKMEDLRQNLSGTWNWKLEFIWDLGFVILEFVIADPVWFSAIQGQAALLNRLDSKVSMKASILFLVSSSE